MPYQPDAHPAVLDLSYRHEVGGRIGAPQTRRSKSCSCRTQQVKRAGARHAQATSETEGKDSCRSLFGAIARSRSVDLAQRCFRGPLSLEASGFLTACGNCVAPGPGQQRH